MSTIATSSGGSRRYARAGKSSVDDQDEGKKQQEDQGMDHKGFSRGNGGDILDKSNLVKMRNGIVVGFVTQTSIYTRKNKKSFRCKHTNKHLCNALYICTVGTWKSPR